MSLKPRMPLRISFSALLLWSFALVGLPLLIGLAVTAYLFDQVAIQARSSVAVAVQLTRTSRQLAQDIDNLQRASGQCLVLQDAALCRGVQQAHEAFVRDAALLQAMPLPPEQQHTLRRLSAQETALAADVLASIQVKNGARVFNAINPQFDAMRRSADTLITHSNGLVDAQQARLQQVSERVWSVLGWLALASVSLSVCLALLFSWLLSQPLRQIKRAIRRLGEGRLDPAPGVAGPRDLVDLGKQLDWLRRRLADLEAQKIQLLRHVSHELKTPLASMKEGVDLLAEGVPGPLNAEQQSIARIMRGNVRDLHQRIDSLIRYDSALHRPEPLQIGPVKLRLLLASLIRRNHLTLRAKGVHVDCGCDALQVQGDRAKLESLFENLLVNAIRLSPQGGRIGFDAHPVEGGTEICVSDQGPGVAPEDREQLFQPFFQGRNQPASALRGTGLGLALARQYAQMHGGTLDLAPESAPGCGAVFRVFLPERTQNPV
ncbi:HAMP domain-containing sensor histidine kinase [Thiomonas sp.]|uniref:sensor histidine kinase n=1 Tax=Thiomonas sp. TaxID=2047785 RepID=UPI002A36D7E4|nr:HAMP domain-containing sensor histidine kinase [Thiomonas sp.]